MDKENFDNLKSDFFQLTGKKADDDLNTYINYINMLLLMDVKDRMETIIKKI